MGLKPRAEPYARLLEQLFAARRFGAVLGTDRIRSLLLSVGSPENKIATRVLVAGTNGKGSTSAFLEAIALGASRRVGVFSSPHLARFAERFRVSGESASESSIAEAAAEVAAAGGDGLTFFEQCTAIALVLFRNLGVDFGIFEVGLGGRLDATRAAAAHLVAVSGVDLDHQEVLGDSLSEIANEKVAAASPGTPLVLGNGGALGSLPALRAAASSQGIGEPIVAEASWPGAIGLRGEFQRANAATAAAAAAELGFNEAAIAEGIARARLPGRYELLRADPDVIVDGAHNPAAARALAAAVASLRPRRTTVILGVSSDKDIAGIAAPLLAVADEVWLSAARSDRSASPEAIGGHIRELDATIPQNAVTLADLPSRLAHADPGERFVAAGSLMFVGELRAQILGEPLDPRPLSDPAVSRK